MSWPKELVSGAYPFRARGTRGLTMQQPAAPAQGVKRACGLHAAPSAAPQHCRLVRAIRDGIPDNREDILNLAGHRLSREKFSCEHLSSVNCSLNSC